MKNKIIYLLAFLLIAASTLQAAGSKNDKIKKLIEITGGTKSVSDMISMALENSKKQYPNISAKFWTDLKNDVQKNDIPKLNGEFMKIYSKYYSDNDLDELLKFFSTPVGKKMLETQPKITNDGMKVSMEWGQKVGKKIQDKIAQQSGKK